EEWHRVSELREELRAALASGAAVPALRVVAVAAYLPLHSLGTPALLQRSWPEPIMTLLIQQVREPLEEQRIRQSIPALTPLEDVVSLRVREQYEDMPYPRWVTAASVGKPVAIDWYLRNRFPLAPMQPLGKRGSLDVLVAGCGTGQHSIETAQRYAGARVLAV